MEHGHKGGGGGVGRSGKTWGLNKWVGIVSEGRLQVGLRKGKGGKGGDSGVPDLLGAQRVFSQFVESGQDSGKQMGGPSLASGGHSPSEE